MSLIPDCVITAAHTINRQYTCEEFFQYTVPVKIFFLYFTMTGDHDT